MVAEDTTADLEKQLTAKKREYENLNDLRLAGQRDPNAKKSEVFTLKNKCEFLREEIGNLSERLTALNLPKR